MPPDKEGMARFALAKRRWDRFGAFAGAVTALVFVACGDGRGSELPAPTVTQPAIWGLHTDSVALGQVLYFFGRDIPEGARVKAHLAGSFHARRADGIEFPHPADLTIALVNDGVFLEDTEFGGVAVPAGTQLLRWNRFGSFRVPFGPSQEPGSFEGAIRGSL